MVAEVVVFKVPHLVVEVLAEAVELRLVLTQHPLREVLVALRSQHPSQQLLLQMIEVRAAVTDQLLPLRG